MQSNTLTRRKYKSIIYVKNYRNIIKKILQDPKPTEKQEPDADPKKIIPDPKHCQKAQIHETYIGILLNKKREHKSQYTRKSVTLNLTGRGSSWLATDLSKINAGILALN